MVLTLANYNNPEQEVEFWEKKRERRGGGLAGNNDCEVQELLEEWENISEQGDRSE